LPLAYASPRVTAHDRRGELPEAETGTAARSAYQRHAAGEEEPRLLAADTAPSVARGLNDLAVAADTA